MITPAHTKAFVLATLHGIEYMHNNFVLHRDLKPNNLLIDLNGVIKIGDFGLAKQFGSPSRELTHQVCLRPQSFNIKKSHRLSQDGIVHQNYFLVHDIMVSELICGQLDA